MNFFPEGHPRMWEVTLRTWNIMKYYYRVYSLRYTRFGMILPQSNLWKCQRNLKFDFIRRARLKKLVNREVIEPARVNYGWN